MGDYEREQERLQKLMEEILAESDVDDVAYDNSSTDESEHEIIQLGNSDTEQDITDVEEIGNAGIVLESEMEQYVPDVEQQEGSDRHYMTFIGKDKETRWKKMPPPSKSVRTRRENIVKRLSGPSKSTSHLKEAMPIWNYFFNDVIINIIVDCTNEYIASIAENFGRSRDAKPTEASEIRAFIGLLYLAGIYHANRLNAEELWNTDGSGIEIFRLTMSLQRFRFLIRSLRFDSKQTREIRRKVDKLAAIREIFEIFVENLKNGYHHSAYVTIDEMLAGFREKCPFRQYIPSKPNKYGIKILALCDAKLFYTSHLEVYVGKQPDGPYQISNSPYDVVHRACSHIFGSGRNITMDNWFTSVPLVLNLLREHRLTVIGTIRKNKRELPLEFSKPAKRPPCTSMFAYLEECTLVSYVPKKNKNVLVVSSMHHDDEIDKITGNLNKPNMITDYNSTKGGVDVVDKLCASYDAARNTRRWPMVVFYAMLNVAGINTQIVYSANNPDSRVLRRKFLKSLSNELILPHLKCRAAITSIPRNLKLRLQEICGGTSDPEKEAIPQERVGGRCVYCSSQRNRKTRFNCFKCKKPMCLEHLIGICRECEMNAFQVPKE